MKERAKSIAHRLGIVGFRASNRYIQKFCVRNKLGYRKATHKAQEKDQSGAESCTTVVEFLQDFNHLLQQEKFYEILNMDEAPFYFDAVSDKTVDDIGARSVDVLTCNGEKSRFTLAVTISSLGEVLPGFIIFKGI